MTPYTGGKPQRNNRFTFSNLFDAFITWFLETFWDEFSNAVDQVSADAARAESAVSAISNSMWVSGSYTAGDVAWSPTDYLDYRCINTGSRTTDPALDPTNWRLRTSTSAGGAATTSSATDITLTSGSDRLQIISMTAPAKKTTLPSATTLQKGSEIFVCYNAGTYRFALHKNGGGFLCYVNPGQVIAVHCSNIGSAAGVWQVSGSDVDQIYGGNTAEVLNAVSSNYIAAAMLTSTQAICAFRNNSTTYLNVVVLNYGSSSGSVFAVNAESSLDISIAAQTSSQATVVYKTSTGVTKGYVLDISGNTPTPGAVATIDSSTTGTGTAIEAISSTQLLCVYQSASASTPRERILSISSSAITANAEVVADSTTSMFSFFRAKKISSSKALVAFRGNSDSKIKLRLQSITGTVPAPTGSVLSVSASGTSYGALFGLVILNSSRALLAQGADRTYADMMLSLIDISGTTPVVLRSKLLRVGLISSADISAAKLDANTVYATWTGSGSLGVDSLTIKVTDDDQIIAGVVAEKLESGVASLDCDALDSTHVMQVCRNSSNYLSAKTIELAA
ncbi:MAG: hypothetical protein K2Q14_06995 [Gammaproteobacteria bacterium]|nr:hypothetical protein [Gammaproteobacteria bacterium]